MAQDNHDVEQEQDEQNGSKYKPDDQDLGRAFIRENAGNYAHLWGEWHEYNSDRGIWEESERAVRRETMEILTRYKSSGIRVSRRKAEAVLDYAELYLPEVDELPHQPDLIPLQNGVYNIRENTFHPHAAENYFRSAMEFDYDPGALCPTWERTLETILVHPDGRTDWELVGFVQEMFGYALWGDNRLQASFFLTGEGGTGKSTVIEVLQSLTDSKMSIDLETLNEYQLASLVDARVVVFNELEEGASFPEAAFKRLVSSDLIEARFPHGRPFVFQPICTVLGAMNSLPRVKDRTRGVFRRVHIIPFHKQITEPDVYLPQKLMKERAGIFAWAMNGLRALMQRGEFEQPKQVADAVMQWRYENDTEKQYLNSGFCELKPDARTQSSELYRSYKNWCLDNGLRPKSIKRVAKEWRRLGLEQVKDSSMYWQGVELNTVNINDL